MVFFFLCFCFFGDDPATVGDGKNPVTQNSVASRPVGACPFRGGRPIHVVRCFVVVVFFFQEDEEKSLPVAGPPVFPSHGPALACCVSRHRKLFISLHRSLSGRLSFSRTFQYFGQHLEIKFGRENSAGCDVDTVSGRIFPFSFFFASSSSTTSCSSPWFPFQPLFVLPPALEMNWK